MVAGGDSTTTSWNVSIPHRENTVLGAILGKTFLKMAPAGGIMAPIAMRLLR